MSEQQQDPHANHHPTAPSASGLPHAVPGVSAAAYAAYTQEMQVSMQKMMEDMHRDPPSGDPDIDFLVMMIPHHQGAIDMGHLLIAAGRDPQTRALVEDIMAAQAAEIAGMRGRLEALRRGGSPDDAYPSPNGTRGDDRTVIRDL